VTALLPRWIDMIFGVTSRGMEAYSIHNTFSPSFFPETMTPALRADREKFEFIRSYAACFGQAPIQIFDNPHPSRTARLRSISFGSGQPTLVFDTNVYILSLEYKHQKLFFVTRKFDLFIYDLKSESVTVCPLLLNAQITDSVLPMMKSLVQTYSGYVLTGAPWDTAFTLSDIRGFPLHIKRLHSQKLSAIALSSRFFATASFDCTVMLWRMRPDRPQVPYAIISKHK
jgi:WD40 repeat protein